MIHVLYHDNPIPEERLLYWNSTSFLCSPFLYVSPFSLDVDVKGTFITTSWDHNPNILQKYTRHKTAWLFCLTVMTSSNGNIFHVSSLFVRGIHRSLVNSPHKGQWRGSLIFSLICVWANPSANHRDAADLRGHRAHYDVTIMQDNHMAISHHRIFSVSVPGPFLLTYLHLRKVFTPNIKLLTVAPLKFDNW